MGWLGLRRAAMSQAAAVPYYRILCTLVLLSGRVVTGYNRSEVDLEEEDEEKILRSNRVWSLFLFLSIMMVICILIRRRHDVMNSARVHRGPLSASNNAVPTVQGVPMGPRGNNAVVQGIAMPVGVPSGERNSVPVARPIVGQPPLAGAPVARAVATPVPDV